MDCERRRSDAFSHRHRGAHFYVRGGWGEEGIFYEAARSETLKPTAAKTSNSNSCDRAVAQVKESEHIPEHVQRVKEQQVLSQYRKRNQINNKNLSRASMAKSTVYGRWGLRHLNFVFICRMATRLRMKLRIELFFTVINVSFGVFMFKFLPKFLLKGELFPSLSDLSRKP